MDPYLGVLGWAGLTAEDEKCWEAGFGGGLLLLVPVDCPPLPNCSLGLYWWDQGQFYCQTKPHISYPTLLEGDISKINQTLEIKDVFLLFKFKSPHPPIIHISWGEKLSNFRQFLLPQKIHFYLNFVAHLNFVTNYRFWRHLGPPQGVGVNILYFVSDPISDNSYKAPAAAPPAHEGCWQ